MTELGDGAGNVPLALPLGKYVLDLKKSACSASEWSSNNYCSINRICVVNNNYRKDEECEACQVQHSRFDWTPLACKSSSGLSYQLGFGIGGGIVLIVLIVIGSALSRSGCRSNSRAYSLQKREETSDHQETKNTIESPQRSAGEPNVDAAEPASGFQQQCSSTDCQYEKTQTLQSLDSATGETRPRTFPEIEFEKMTEKRKTSRKTRSADLSNSPTAEGAQMHSLKRESRTSETPPTMETSLSSRRCFKDALPLTWTVGKKAIKVGMHELTFEFPANCLEQEERLTISLQYEETSFGKNGFVYFYTIEPHNLAFKKPIFVRCHNKWAAAETHLYRRESASDDEWTDLGNFGAENILKLERFCDLCICQAEKLAVLGKGYSFHNILVIGRRAKSFITVDVKILAKACIDTLEAERKRWRNDIQEKCCFTKSEELLLYEEGKLTVTFSDPKEEASWKIHENTVAAVDVKTLKLTLGGATTLATNFVVPKKGKTMKDVLENLHPCVVTASFNGSDACPEPRADTAELILTFAEHQDKIKRSMYVQAQAETLIMSVDGEQSIKLRETAHGTTKVMKVPPESDFFPEDSEILQTCGKTWYLILAAASVIASSSLRNRKKLATALNVHGEIENSTDDLQWVEALRDWADRESTQATVAKLLKLSRWAGIDRKLFEEEFLNLFG